MSLDSENLMNDDLIEFNTDERKSRDHIIDSVNLLIFTFLLILVILTVWLFKHYKFRYIHETGLAIIYGTIFGIIIRYGFDHPDKKIISMSKSNASIHDIPDYIYLSIANRTKEVFVYSFKNPKLKTDHLLQEYEEKVTFDPEIFFNILLPPIIFHAGYSMKRRHFFKNFGAILTFALIGTAISCFFIGGFMYTIISIFSSVKSYFTFTDCLFFGAIISATDPVTVLAIFHNKKVNVNLYALVFGESVLNDAVSIVLAQAIEKYSGESKDTFDMAHLFDSIRSFFVIFFGAFGIGSSMGCVTALLTKYTYIRQHSGLETALFILMSYSTFLAAEACEYTGIVSVLFCGIFQAHYTYNNLSEESQVQTKEIFNLLNFLSENFIFVYIGISLFTFGHHQWEFSFIIGAVIAIILARAINIYPLAYVINLSRSKKNKVDIGMQHFLVFSGLRGAMAFALAMRNTSTQARKLILTTTSVIVIITVIICGGLTNKVMTWLRIDESGQQPIENDRDEEPRPPQNSFTKFKQLICRFGLFKFWHSFDKNFMKPFLTNATPTLVETMPECCLPVARCLTTKEQSGIATLNYQNHQSQSSLVSNNNSSNRNQPRPSKLVALDDPFEEPNPFDSVVTVRNDTSDLDV